MTGSLMILPFLITLGDSSLFVLGRKVDSKIRQFNG